MNPDSITPHQNLIAFLRSAKVPLAPPSFDQAVEASAADAKRRLQLDQITSDDAASAAVSHVADAAAASHVDDASAISNSANLSDSTGEVDASPASTSANKTDSPSDVESVDFKAAAESEPASDGQSPDANDTLAHTLRPYWIPVGLDLSTWPPKLVADVAALVNPLYLELVLAAPSPMAQSVGSTIVYLHWLEILDQLEIGCGSLNNEFVRLERAMNGDPRPALIERYLRIAGAKLRFSNFLLRLQEIKKRHEQSSTRRVRKTRRRRRDETSDSEWSASGVRRGRTIAELAEEYERRNSDNDR